LSTAAADRRFTCRLARFFRRGAESAQRLVAA
jgi:hypothetical protein